jgi:probable addiction module antidote protein
MGTKAGAKTTLFDPADYLSSEDDIVEYLKVWMEDGSTQEIARALGDVARSKGMTEIAKTTGLGRQALYSALSENGNPTLETLTAVLDALGLELTVQRKAA